MEYVKWNGTPMLELRSLFHPVDLLYALRLHKLLAHPGLWKRKHHVFACRHQSRLEE